MSINEVVRSNTEHAYESSLTIQNHLSRLPVETLSLICNNLNVEDIQALSLTSKHCRLMLLQIRLDEPILFPLTRKAYHEIQLKITKTLILNTHEYAPQWISKVLRHFKNLATIEVATKNITSNAQIRRLLKDSHDHNLRSIYVHKGAVSRWQIILKRISKDATLTIKALPDEYHDARQEILSAPQEDDYQNPLLPKHFHEIPRLTVQTWMTPVPDIVDVFNRFKQVSLDQFKSTGSLSTPLQVLALNNIFFFSPPAALDYMIPIQGWEQVLTNCRDKYQVYSLPDDEAYQIRLNVEKFEKEAYYSFSRIGDYVNTLRDSDMNPCVFYMLKNISRRISHRIDLAQTKDGFTLNVVDPILNAYFDNSIPFLQYHGNNYEVPESKARKLEQALNDYQDASQVSGRRADRSALIDISNNQHKHTAYICKIETEATSRYGTDLPKIAAMLKDILNEALEYNVSNQEYCAVGILIEGTQGTILTMDLPYPKMYRLIELDTFNLPSNMNELCYLSSVVKPLLNMKELIKKNVSIMLPLQYSLSSTSSSYHDLMTESNKSPAHYTEYYD